MANGLRVLEQRRRKIVRKAEKVVEMAMQASKIDDDSLKPEGWTDEEFRVAKDARLPSRDAPSYLDMCRRIKENTERLEAAKADNTPKSLNIGTINIVGERRKYDVIDVEGKEVK